jgi:NTP pyrophosphatase (non-canonical NTP hydrolase)
MDNEDKIKVHKLVDTLLDHVASDADLMLGKLMLEVTEIAEAAEAVRKGDLVNFKEERADSLIRHLDINDAVGVPTYDEVMRKMAVNEGRPHKHGKQTSI